jgi:DNA-binding winged helix-turn-helix (wHTH) protein/tetratricopeptide (TPR) repeat protein
MPEMVSTVFEWGPWTFEPKEWRLTSASHGVVSLPNKSLALLRLLLERAPGLVSKDDILGAVWRGTVVEEGNIAFHVAALRKTLDAPGGPSCLETVRGRGYRFVAPVVRRASADTPAYDVPEPIAPAAIVAPDEATRTAPATPRVSGRLAATFWSAAVLASAVSLLGWSSLSNLSPRVGDIVVMPVRASADASAVEGASEMLAAQLTRQTTLGIRGASWGTPGETALEAGRRLRADTVLTAAVDRSRDPARVDVELTRVRDAQRIWHWVFEQPSAADANAVLASRIASGVGRHLGVLVPASGPAAEVQTLVLQARESWRQRTPHSVQHAIALYERVIAIDPSFAPAYAGLADCYNLTMSGLPAGLRYERARQNAERALSLDPTLAAGHTAIAFVRYKFEWKWREADAGFRRAIAADPSYALARHWYGEFLGLTGRYPEAVDELRRALALEPGSLAIQSDLVPPLLRAGRIAEARAVVEAAAKVNPNWHWIPRRMSEVLAAEGRERESLEEFWRALVLSGATLDAIEPRRAAYRAGGMPALLRLEIAQLEAGGLAPAGVPQQATFLSFKYAHLGDRDKALHWIGTALDRREDAAIHLRTHPDYESLRGDPRFDALLARAGLQQD